jgi:hypothetical protein
MYPVGLESFRGVKLASYLVVFVSNKLRNYSDLAQLDPVLDDFTRLSFVFGCRTKYIVTL